MKRDNSQDKIQQKVSNSDVTSTEKLGQKGKMVSNNDLTKVVDGSSDIKSKNSLAVDKNPIHQSVSLPSHQGGNINVICRFRPLNEREKKETSVSLSTEFHDSKNITVTTTAEENSKDQKGGSFKFSFDRIFNVTESQIAVYECAGKPIVESILDGFNGTIFAYGQTGSGKTFTMNGVLENPELEGLIPRIIKEIFERIATGSSDIEYNVKVSMIEIYMEKIKDLVDPTRENLNVREEKGKGLYIEGLSETEVINVEEVYTVLKIGNDNRSVAFTKMNDNSSRSHSIVIITIKQNNLTTLVAKSGKLYLVDLAGSEKISKTGAEGMTLEEGKSINKSLTVLGMVINSLTDGKSTHIPYRDSKLTRVLQESLGGNSKTSLIVTASPSVFNDQETVSTLRFGMRVKNIKNKAKVNKEVTLAELKLQVERLEIELKQTLTRNVQYEKFIKRKGLEYSEDDSKVKVEEKEVKEDEGGEKVDKKVYEEFAEELRLYKLKLETTETQITRLSGQNEKLQKRIDELEETIENNEYDQMEINATYHAFKDRIEEYEKQDLEREKDIIVRVSKESIEKNANELITTETLTSQAIIDQFLLKELEELVKIKPELKEIAKDYQIHLLLNNSKEKKQSSKQLLDSLTEDHIELIKTIQLDKIPNLKIYNKDDSDIDSIRSQLEELRKENTQLEEEKNNFIKALDEKDTITKNLEEEKHELVERAKIIEMKIDPNDKVYVEKIRELEKKIETVNLMYHHITTQKAIIKIECEILEKKLKVRQEKISVIEKENQDVKNQIRNLNERLLQHQLNMLKAQGNIKRTLRGGGGVVVNLGHWIPSVQKDKEKKYQSLLPGMGNKEQVNN